MPKTTTNNLNPTLKWKVGFEIELLAPKGKTRRSLARIIAQQQSGSVQTIFYPQSEISEVTDLPVFENLVLGFDVISSEENLVARCVDDLTITDELDFHAPSKKGWFRIISDDGRLLELVRNHCDPNVRQSQTLAPIATLFKSTIEKSDNAMFKVSDQSGRSVAIAASLPGERERVCELITPPIEHDHLQRLEELLHCANELNFIVPKQAAVHIHFDAKRLKNTHTFCRMVAVFSKFGPELKTLFNTNRNCRRVGDVPFELTQQCGRSGFSKMGWKPAAKILQKLRLSKFSDFNFMNMVHNFNDKNTFEVRILPGSMSAASIYQQAVFFANILHWCSQSETQAPIPNSFTELKSIMEWSG